MYHANKVIPMVYFLAKYLSSKHIPSMSVPNMYINMYHYLYRESIVGRLVVVIDINPSYGFWTGRLMKVFGHEGKCTCRYNTHGWIVYIMLFPMVCGTPHGSSWLRRNEFLKMTK
jgi:hypothetical protein